MSDKAICYLDNNATTRVAPEVVEAMLPYLTEQWGNPSSAYSFGKQVGRALDAAREKVAALINADPREIIFTSCGTEGNNTAIHSALVTQPGKRHIVTTAVEHSANIKLCAQLEKRGYELTLLPVDSLGELDVHLLHESIRKDTAIVSVMYANNETGVVFPIEEIAAICRARGVLFHTDAVQTAGKFKLDVRQLGADFLSLSAHKLHAPKGVGMLFARRGVPFSSLITGGGQEQARRGGTENVPYIVGFGRAAELAMESLGDVPRIKSLRDRMEQGLLASIPNSRRNGIKEPRLPNTSNIAISDCEAEGILLLLDRAGICASSGSACTTGSLEPSHVLTAMGLSRDLAKGSIRLSLSKYNSDADVDRVLRELPVIVSKLRGEPVSM